MKYSRLRQGISRLAATSFRSFGFYRFYSNRFFCIWLQIQLHFGFRIHIFPKARTILDPELPDIPHLSASVRSQNEIESLVVVQAFLKSISGKKLNVRKSMICWRYLILRLGPIIDIHQFKSPTGHCSYESDLQPRSPLASWLSDNRTKLV